MTSAREWFELSHRGLTELLGELARDARIEWGGPALGVWDLRALLGHTCRAYQTIEVYLDPGSRCSDPDLARPAEYFRRMLRLQTTADDIAARGVESGQALGRAPARAALEIADRVSRLVGDADDTALVTTPVGTMQLVNYLQTRAFELTVHGTDLALAAGVAIPAALEAAMVPAITLCAELAHADTRRALLRAATGRDGMPPGFSVLGA